MSAALDFKNIRHGFAGKAVLDGLTLHIPEGKVTCLLGPSGCGKTTLLRIAAGLERPWSGQVRLGGRDVDGAAGHLPPEDRNVGFLFQDFALFPHLTVLDNVAFGIRTGSRSQRRDRAQDLLGRLGIADKAEIYPHLLSGGQQQRVALARALAPDPVLLLLDEPFSGLDTVLRRGIYDELRLLLNQTGVTAVVVTHDPVEAMVLGDRIVLMNQGRIEQQGVPEDLYLRPANAFAMTFLGEANLLPARVTGGRVETPLGCAADSATASVTALIRPEHIRVAAGGAEGAPARVESRVFVGRATRLRLVLEDGTLLTAEVPGVVAVSPGAAVTVSAQATDIHVFPAD